MVWIDKVLSSSFTDVNNAVIWSLCKVRPLLIKCWLWIMKQLTIINHYWSWLMDDGYLQMDANGFYRPQTFWWFHFSRPCGIWSTWRPCFQQTRRAMSESLAGWHFHKPCANFFFRDHHSKWNSWKWISNFHVESEHHLSRGRTMRLNHVKSRYVCRKIQESMNIIKIHKSSLVFNNKHQINTIQIHIKIY